VNQNWTTTIEELAAVLERWRGATAQAMGYTTGHGVFILGLLPTDRSKFRCAYIQCKDCQVIQLYQTYWPGADITVSVAPHRLGQLYTFTDPGHFHLVCYAAFAIETDTPINFHREWSNL
jgi:hypothetical protein